jgi:hypothetical protein
MQSNHVFFLSSLAAICLIAGCEPVLETGYKPRPLNASDAVRRAYYAPAFTPEAMPQKKDEGEGAPGLDLGGGK